MSIYSNDNIRKIAKLTTRELPQKSKNAKITVRENNGLYSINHSISNSNRISGQNRVSGPTAYAVLQWGRLPPTFLSHVQMRALVRAFT